MNRDNSMQPEDFKPDDLFAQIQGLVDALAAERNARERAESSERAKAQLLNVIGHELRTPMGAVISMAELLLSSPLDTSQRRYAETLEQSARSLLTVLNDILDFSQLDTGHIELDCESFDLHELVQEVAGAMQARAGAKGIGSGLDIGFSCPRNVIGDPTRLRQILDAVVESAVDTLAEGSLRLHVRARDSDGHLRLRFDIVASGPELKQAVKPSGEASGLESSVARHLIDMMGGELGSDSVAGHGSVVWFTVAAARAPEVPPKAKREDAATDRSALSGHVLVIESNAVNRMLIGAYLDEFGLTYEMVGSGAEAILCLASSRYDLLLMDITSPGFDGAQTARRIRNLGPTGALPIVALTAAKRRDGTTPTVAAMDACVAKPIRGRELHAALAPFLSVEDQGRAAAG